MKSKILTAGTVITMDEAHPRAEAVAIDGDTIIAVGSLADCQAVAPEADLVDTGAAVLMPGFIDPHSHPLLSGATTQAPAIPIGPWIASSWEQVKQIFVDTAKKTDPTRPLVFSGFDALLHGHPFPDAAELDAIFGDRVVVVSDNSGHGVYFTSALIRQYHWEKNPPADPEGGRFARDESGALLGQAFEVAAMLPVVNPVLEELGASILASAAEYFAWMSSAGITSTSDMTYSADQKAGYEALIAMPSSPLRISMWQISTQPGFADPVEFAADEKWLVKRGVKLWTDGTPWIGNVALSFPYLDTPATETAGINPATAGGIDSLNFTRETVDSVIDDAVAHGWGLSFHCNGDLAIDFALAAYEDGLTRHGLLGTDHRWRLEHLGAGRPDQFQRAARLGVYLSMSPFQYYYWGDLLDGQMFDHEHGARWQALGDALASGAILTMHNDGAVSPPTPLLNVQTAVTRRTRNGNVHGAEQCIDLDSALKGHTINAARTLRADDKVGSLEVGKLADLVELSADPYAVDPLTLADAVAVLGTWVGGARIDLNEFLTAAGAVHPDEQAHLRAKVHAKTCC